MKNVFLILTAVVVTVTFHVSVFADNTLASTLDVYVFPKDGQSATEQSKAESECYGWASKNSGVDPFEAEKAAQQGQKDAEQQKQQAKKAGQGSAARGAVRGAAFGALIGEIVDDDAGDGAGWGAAVGAARGGKRGRQARRNATEDAERQEAQSQQASATQIENFKKAFSVCLEAKEYLVKY